MAGGKSAGTAAALMVIAKSPEPGRVKTRLSPPLDPAGAGRIALACLHDTIDAAEAAPARRHVLVLDGPPGPWLPPGWDVVPQWGSGLAARLANAFADVGPPAVVIAMDTPQVSPASLRRALSLTAEDRVAPFGPARDGGFWAIGLPAGCRPEAVFAGIPMSTPDTGAAQLARLHALGLPVAFLEELRDIDDLDDLLAVATVGPPRLAAAVEYLLPSRVEVRAR
jgi:glycosyltransferase A (GT-A) superfamily protein (DUF2064 family)